MENSLGTLHAWGWNDWFEGRYAPHPGETLARVAAVDRDQLLLVDQTGFFRARLAGRLLHPPLQAPDLPCVGDWVAVEKPPGSGMGRILALLERRTVLRRKAAGELQAPQTIAANLDFAIVVQSCHFDFNWKRLERYLVMVRDGGAEPYILLTKTDLVEPAVLADQLAAIRATGTTAPVLTLSNVIEAGVDAFRAVLLPGKTYCFVGSSGVGKSTLINRLLGDGHRETKAVSGTGEGRHTTVRRELIRLENGALVIDNPGMREFGILDAEDGLEDSFSAITTLAVGCRYRDCSHANEPGCAVLAAVQSGALSRERYAHYLQLKEESAFFALSAAERRKKDRDFGKHLKSVKKRRDDR